MRAINGDMPLYESPTVTCSQKMSKIPLLGPFFLRTIWLLRLFKTVDVYHTTNFKYQMRCLYARGSNIFCVGSFSRQYSYCCYSNQYTNMIYTNINGGDNLTMRK